MSRTGIAPSAVALPCSSQASIGAAEGSEVVNLPMISSMMSSSVTRPISSPYSSTTSATRSLFSWKYCSCASTGVVEGTK